MGSMKTCSVKIFSKLSIMYHLLTYVDSYIYLSICQLDKYSIKSINIVLLCDLVIPHHKFNGL